MNTLRSLAALSALSIGLVACADGPTSPNAATAVRSSREAQPGDDRGVREVERRGDRGAAEVQPGDDKGAGHLQSDDKRRWRGTGRAVVRASREAQPGDDRGGHGTDDPTPHT